MSTWAAPGGDEAPASVVSFPSRRRPATVDGVLPPLIPLRPLQMVDGALALLRARPRQMMLISFAFVVPPQLIVAVLQRQALRGFDLRAVLSDPTTTSGTSIGANLAIVAAWVVSSLSLPFVAAAVAPLVVADRLGQRDDDVFSTRRSLRSAVRVSWPLLVSWLLIHLLYLVGLFCLFVPGVLLMGRFIVVAPAIALEGSTGNAAIARSWRLSRHRYWACLGVGLASGIVAWVINQALSGLPQVLAIVTLGNWGWLISAAAGIATAVVTTPILATTSVLLYLDLRVRIEGMDLDIDVVQAFER